MPKPIITKRCPGCKQVKQFSEFSKDRTTKDGLQIYCKPCKKIYQQDYQQSEKYKAIKKHYKQSEKGKETDKCFRIRHPEQSKARNAVNNAIKGSKLPRPNTKLCHYCPKPAQEYHHWHGYEPKYRLDVVPVCKKCHNLTQ